MRRRSFGLLVAVPLGVLLVALLFRPFWLGMALRVGLAVAGATEPDLRVERANPTRLEIVHARWRIGAQPWSIDRLEVSRDRWYSPDLGAIVVEGLRGVVPVERLGTSNSAGSVPKVAPSGAGISVVSLPARSLSLDGQITLSGPTREQELHVGLKSSRAEDGRWLSDIVASAPGIELRMEVKSALARSRHEFRLSRGEVDLAKLQGFGSDVLGVAPRDYRASGRLEISAEGRIEGSQVNGRAHLKLSEGGLASLEDGVSLEGLEVDVLLDDLAGLKASGSQRLAFRSAQHGELKATNLRASFGLQGATQINFEALSVELFGGKVSTEPFRWNPQSSEIETTLVVDRLQMQEVVRLLEDLPAKASGEISGRIPLAYGPSGIVLGRGWLGLSEGRTALVEFQADGLLTAGLESNNPGYPVLRQIETGLLKLSVGELRLDLYPDGPKGERSAALKLAGQPVEEKIRAPISLNLNFRGPIEELVNAGLRRELKSHP